MNAIINTKTVFSVSGHFDRTKSMSHMLFYINIPLNVVAARFMFKFETHSTWKMNYQAQNTFIDLK